MRCGGFMFRRGVSEQELIAFFALAGAVRAKSESLDEARQLLRSRGVFGIELSPPYGTPGWFGGNSAPVEEVVAAEVIRGLGGSVPAFQRLREAVESAHDAAERNLEVDVAGSRGTIESLLDAMADDAAQVLHFARYPDFASYTVGHSVRVALLMLLVGRRLGLEERLLVEVGTAGLLHDVGKSKIPHEVLFKRGRLDDEERKIIATHPIIGANILLATQDAPPLGIAAAFGHHLRHDRGGYPHFAPWGARGRVTALVHVCDVFEALTAVRPYKPPLSPQRAFEIMLSDPGTFDPSAFAAFVSAVGLYPPGSRVRLTTGEEGFVLRVGPDPTKPVIELTRGKDGTTLPKSDRVAIDLAQAAQAAGREVDDVILDDVLPASSQSAPPRPKDESVTATMPEALPKPPKCCHDDSHVHAEGEPAHAA
jgi:HD-GYP domain-containing protein (c-di-GMP phosphodiesterase class II)